MKKAILVTNKPETDPYHTRLGSYFQPAPTLPPGYAGPETYREQQKDLTKNPKMTPEINARINYDPIPARTAFNPLPEGFEMAHEIGHSTSSKKRFGQMAAGPRNLQGEMDADVSSFVKRGMRPEDKQYLLNKYGGKDKEWAKYKPGDIVGAMNRAADIYARKSFTFMKASDIHLSAKAIIRKGRKVLILKDAYSNYWDLPGGHVKDEETIEDGLKREVKEESGLTVMSCKAMTVKQMTLGKETKPVCFYVCQADGNIKLSKEHTDFKWVELNDISKYNVGKFKEFILDSKGMVMKSAPNSRKGHWQENPPNKSYWVNDNPEDDAPWKKLGSTEVGKNPKYDSEADPWVPGYKHVETPEITKDVDPEFKEEVKDRIPELKTPLQQTVVGKLDILAQKMEALMKSGEFHPEEPIKPEDIKSKADAKRFHSQLSDVSPDKFNPNRHSLETAKKVSKREPIDGIKDLSETVKFKPKLTEESYDDQPEYEQEVPHLGGQHFKYDKTPHKLNEYQAQVEPNIMNSENVTFTKKELTLSDIGRFITQIQKQVILSKTDEILRKAEEQILIGTFLQEYKNKLILKDLYEGDENLQMLAGRIAKIKGFETKSEILDGIRKDTGKQATFIHGPVSTEDQILAQRKKSAGQMGALEQRKRIGEQIRQRNLGDIDGNKWKIQKGDEIPWGPTVTDGPRPSRESQSSDALQPPTSSTTLQSGASLTALQSGVSLSSFTPLQSGANGQRSVDTNHGTFLAYPAAIGKLLLNEKKATCTCSGCNSNDCPNALNKQLLSGDIRKGLDLETGKDFWKLYNTAVSTGVKALSNEDLVILREFLYSRV
jgi:8-oxo-dGTP pyrophosphatase MutT (NUDIX family)